MNDDRIEQNKQDTNLTTADLARSAETEERRKENRILDATADNSIVAPRTRDVGQTRDAVRTDVSAARTDVIAGSRPAAVAVGTATATAAATAPAFEGEYARLFSENDAKGFRARWENLQVSFVDEPRHSVEQADSLVAEAIKRLAEVFADERQKLEKQWDRGDNVSTEDLRLALQRYRAFFGRLLSV